MKISKTLAAVGITMIIAGCSSSANADKADDTTAADSIVAEQVEEEVVPEVVAEVVATPDQALLGVKGSVKKITGRDGNIIAEFDKDGNLLKYEGGNKISQVKRNDDKQLISFLGEVWNTVNWEYSKPVKIERQLNEEDVTTKYTFDEQGNVIKEDVLYEFAGEEPVRYTIEYCYGDDSFDKNGNWVQRTAKVKGEAIWPPVKKRNIEYFEH